jgi:hypothetical protein
MGIFMEPMVQSQRSGFPEINGPHPKKDFIKRASIGTLAKPQISIFQTQQA